MTDAQKRKLEQKLWNIANALRGKMSADDYRDYILGFIFYKYLSEKIEAFANEQLKENKITLDQIDEKTKEGQQILGVLEDVATESLGYFLKPSELFKSIVKRSFSGESEDSSSDGNEDEESSFILDDLQAVLNNIENSTMGTESEDDFDKLFEDLDLTSTKLGRTGKAKNQTVVKILRELNKIDFALKDTEADVLGDAYEYLIGQFAAGAGKKAGEFYTPQQVSKILSKLVTTGKHKLHSVYDPTCGSGSLLLRVAREVPVSNYFGQEQTRTTYNLARMNMLLHDVHYRKFDIRHEDTLGHPEHRDLKFEAIVANPPFSAKWSASKIFETDDRFAEYGRLAPKTKADYAFIQHMLYHLADNGHMAVIMPHGVLFRGAAEGVIRKYIIKEKNVLDAVIGLPANVFYGTSIPTCIMVFKKCREHPENILFIDASNDFEKGKNQNYLTNNHVDKIVNAYRERKTVEKYSYVASIKEIAEEHDYNLNIPRYVDTFEEEEPIDLKAVTDELKQLDKDMIEVDQAIAAYCQELGIKAPF